MHVADASAAVQGAAGGWAFTFLLLPNAATHSFWCAPCLWPQVGAAIAAKEALQAAKDVRTLIAVDDYNALYWQTGEPPLCIWHAFVSHAAWLRRGKAVREYREQSVAIAFACLLAALAHVSGQRRRAPCCLL